MGARYASRAMVATLVVSVQLEVDNDSQALSLRLQASGAGLTVQVAALTGTLQEAAEEFSCLPIRHILTPGKVLQVVQRNPLGIDSSVGASPHNAIGFGFCKEKNSAGT